MALGWSPRKNMAMGSGMPSESAITGSGNFGVSKGLSGKSPRTHMDRNNGDADCMADGNRACGPSMGGGGKRMHNQANPDHGPHHSW